MTNDELHAWAKEVLLPCEDTATRLRFADGEEGYDLDYIKEKYREINPVTYYAGSELQWSAEDVMNNAEHLGVELTESEAESLLVSTFDNIEYLMELIAEMITKNILEYKKQ